MKFTSALRGQHFGHWFKKKWIKKSRMAVVKPKLHPELVAKGVQLVDPVNNYMRPTPPKASEMWRPNLDDPRFMFPPRPEDSPDYHEDVAFTFTPSTKLWEGTKQAALLSNSIIREGVPYEIPTFDDEERLDNIMQRIILGAHLWDNTRQKLPARQKPDDISLMNYKTEFGIPLARIQETLLSNILLKSTQLLQTHGRLDYLEDYSFNICTETVGINLYVENLCKYIITSATPLKAVVPVEDYGQLKGKQLPDLFPQAPTIDLNQSHIYKSHDSPWIDSPFTCQVPHTLMLRFEPTWKMEQRHASALMSSYALLKRFREANQLTEPNCIQTIHTDGEFFGFTVLQMNTNASSENGFRNIAWVNDERLFEKVTPRRSMLRNTQYKEYNPQVFRKILTLLSQ